MKTIAITILLLLSACAVEAPAPKPEPLPDPVGPFCVVPDAFGPETVTLSLTTPGCVQGATCHTAYGEGVCQP